MIKINFVARHTNHPLYKSTKAHKYSTIIVLRYIISHDAMIVKK